MNSFISEERREEDWLLVQVLNIYARGSVLHDSNKCNVHVKYDADTI